MKRDVVESLAANEQQQHLKLRSVETEHEL